MKNVLKEAVLSIALPVMERAARSYVAGPELEDALRVSRKLAGQGFRSITCFWDGPGDDSKQIATAHSAAIRRLSAEDSDTYVALKAPSLQYSHELMMQLMQAGQEKQILLHFDALDLDSVDRTFSLISDILPSYSRIGCTLPGRWKRSLGDADWAIHHALLVRVVKGQWPDPVYSTADLRAGFLKVIERLAGRASRVGVASHDPEVVRPALRMLLEAGTPCELELLYGLPVEPALAVARSMNVTARFYIPYGHAWLPYSLSQAKRNPRILWWTMRDMILKRRDSVYS